MSKGGTTRILLFHVVLNINDASRRNALYYTLSRKSFAEHDFGWYATGIPSTSA